MTASSAEMPEPAAEASRSAAKPEIGSHTGLRGVAAMLVVFYHVQFGASHRLGLETATSFFAKGYLWVDLFFIMSGFIITYTAAPASQRPFSIGGARGFVVARLARVYPLLLFCLAYLVLARIFLNLILEMTGGDPPDYFTPEGVRDLVIQAALLDAWPIHSTVGWNIPAWSISAELVAYLTFPLLVYINFRLRRIAQAGMLATAIAFYALIWHEAHTLDVTIGLSIPRCLAGFSIGMLLCLNRHLVSGWRLAVVTGLQLVSVAALLAVLISGASDFLAVPPFILLVLSTWEDRGLVAQLLCRKALRGLGTISYSIYLNHVCLIEIAWFFWGRMQARLPSGIDADALRAAWLIFAVMAVLLCSKVTFDRVEYPARIWIRRRFIKERVPSALVPAP